MPQLCTSGRTPISRISLQPIARYRGNNPRSIHLANTVIVRIGDIDIARTIYKNIARMMHLCVYSKPTVAEITTRTISGYSADLPHTIHFVDAIVHSIRYVYIPRIIDKYTFRFYRDICSYASVSRSPTHNRLYIPGRCIHRPAPSQHTTDYQHNQHASIQK